MNEHLPLCIDTQILVRCDKFNDMQPEERFKFAQMKRLCFNCLVPGHMSGKCTVRQTKSPDEDLLAASSNTAGARRRSRRVALPIVLIQLRAKD